MTNSEKTDEERLVPQTPEILVQPALTEDELYEALNNPWLAKIDIEAIKVDLDLGRGFTNPISYIPDRGSKMDAKYTEEQIQNTNSAKGYRVFSYLADIMQRYPFDLDVTRGGRIFVDATNDCKLRRKLVKTDKEQNSEFEIYRTEDGSNRVKDTITVSKETTTPSMLAAIAAAQVNNEDITSNERLAIMFLQAGAALLQEGEKVRKATAKLNGENDPTKAEFYKHLNNLHSRAYGLTIVSDILNYVAGDNEGLADNMNESLNFANRETTDEIYGEGARQEMMDAVNMVFAGVSGIGLSQVFSDIIEMTDAIKENIGDAALVELSSVEQK